MVVGQKHILPSLRFSVEKKLEDRKSFTPTFIVQSLQGPIITVHSLNRNFLDLSFQNNEAILFWTDCKLRFAMWLVQFNSFPVLRRPGWRIFAHKYNSCSSLKISLFENSKNLSPPLVCLIPHCFCARGKHSNNKLQTVNLSLSRLIDLRSFHWNRTCTEIFVKICRLIVYIIET